MNETDQRRENLIRIYFQLGLHHQEIIACLLLNDDIAISLRQLRRILGKLQLFRRKRYSDIRCLVQFIERQILKHGQLHGYRWMHLKCLQNDFVVTQNTVRELLRLLDPNGVVVRQRRRLRRRRYYNKGPNYLWHTDCYDKLKPFGICVTGCIDGYSRYIIWLKAGPNTNNPTIIAYHFLKAVGDLKGCPQSVRSDMGTENTMIERVQNRFRNNGVQGQSHLPAFLYGTSQANQRIEAWWSMLRKHHSQFWLNLFHGLKDNGLFCGSFTDKALLQFCFLQIIQKELDTVMTEWNMHKIAKSRNSISPCGRPFMMFHTPQLYNTRDYLHVVSREGCEEWRSSVSTPKYNSDPDVQELAIIIMQEERWSMPTEPSAAVDLYLKLRERFSVLVHTSL